MEITPVRNEVNPSAQPQADALDGAAPAHVATVLWNLSSREERADLLAGPPPPSTAPTSGPAPASLPPSASEALARKLVHAGGTGDQSDVDLVVAQLKQLPPDALKVLVRAHTQVIACRNKVADGDPAIGGVQPRGWPSGYKFNTVPGVYDQAANKVVIAIRGHGTPEGAHVPRTGDGQGSYNLAIHETMHAVDAHARGGPLSSTPAFTAARAHDLAALSGYERQGPLAGPQETFAESAARFYGGDPNAAKTTPALDAYWRADPLAHR